MKTRGFNYLPAVRLGRKEQGLIYYLSHNYFLLPEDKRRIIDEHIEAVGGENASALRRYMTTDDTAVRICLDEYIGSPNSIYMMQREYYETFPLSRILS
nr:MAG TPA: hypothetical protein [Caudoviricetes sp.]